MAALGVDKAALSKMLIVTRQVPIALVTAIGAAPEIGRRRWLELGERLETVEPDVVLAQLSADNSGQLSSDERFHRALAFASKRPALTTAPAAKAQISGVPVQFKKTASSATFVFDNKAAPGFDQFVQERLVTLFAEFQQNKGA